MEDTEPGNRDNKAIPFFLVGCWRSGTTLLRLLLGHHPSICRCNEFDFSTDFLKDGQFYPALPDYHRYLEHSRAFKSTNYKIDYSLDYARLLQNFLTQLQQEDGRPVVGATVHNNFHRLVDIWPDAKFIYLRRDPRNVSRSIVKKGWAGTTWHATLSWNRAEHQWNILKSRIAPGQYIEIRYEDLIAETVDTLKKITSLLKLDYHPNMLEIEKDTTYKKPSRKEAQNWKNAASKEEIQLIEACAGNLLLDAGYEHSTLPAQRLNAIDKLQLRIRNRYNKIRFSINQYGIILWLGTVISRRLPFEGFKNRVNARIDEIVTTRWK